MPGIQMNERKLTFQGVCVGWESITKERQPYLNLLWHWHPQMIIHTLDNSSCHIIKTCRQKADQTIPASLCWSSLNSPDDEHLSLGQELSQAGALGAPAPAQLPPALLHSQGRSQTGLLQLLGEHRARRKGGKSSPCAREAEAVQNTRIGTGEHRSEDRHSMQRGWAQLCRAIYSHTQNYLLWILPLPGNLTAVHQGNIHHHDVHGDWVYLAGL